MHKDIKKAFDEIGADRGFKERLKLGVTEKLPTEKRKNYFKYAVAAAACMLVLCLGLVGYKLYFTPITVISVDINPSVELGINRFDKVVTVEAFNEEGAEIADSVNVKHLNYKDAVDKLLNDDSFAKYVETEGTVYLTVFGDNKETDSVAEKLMEYSSERGDVNCKHGGKGNKEAHKNGLSAGKYDAYLKMKEYNPDLTVEQVKGMTMRELMENRHNDQNNNRPNHNGDTNKPDTDIGNPDIDISRPNRPGKGNESHDGQGNQNSHGNGRGD